MELGPHQGFILTAYGLTVLVSVVLIGWVICDHKRQRRMLSELEKLGIRRRSDPS